MPKINQFKMAEVSGNSTVLHRAQLEKLSGLVKNAG
jgi:hypothetical protein